MLELDHDGFKILQKKLLEEKNIHLPHGGFSNKRVCVFIPDHIAELLRKEYSVILDGPYFTE